jgi:hypothetical protein
MRDQDSLLPPPVDDDVYALADQGASVTQDIREYSGTPASRGSVETARKPSPAAGDASAAAPKVAETAPAPKSNGAARPRKGLALLWRNRTAASSTTTSADGTTPRRAKGEINLRGKQAPRRKWTDEAPAWALSAIVHGTIFGVLAVAGLTPQIQDALVRSIDAAPFDPKLDGSPEEAPILADPTGVEPTEATAPLDVVVSGTGAVGTGPPSPTPNLPSRGPGSSGGIPEDSLPRIKVAGPDSPISVLPAMPAVDREGWGGISGDVLEDVDGVGEALDQLAREILRKLANHKLTVVWLFDESGSMKDDQQAIKEEFGRVATELKLGLKPDQKSAGVLNHAIVGFGADFHLELPKPTAEIDEIGSAIERLMVDESGVENTLQAIQRTIAEYSKLITKDRRLMIVLVTDESGDDGAQIEEARQMAMSHDVQIYVIGRQALFGYDRAHLLYIDPVTKDHYWPAIKRGPEAAGFECLQWDGLHERWDEQPSGFPPYELARLVKSTGGIYFLLPSEENLRVRRREHFYSTDLLREYLPEHLSRTEYIKVRNSSVLRRSMYEIIEGTKDFGFRRHFPVEPVALQEAIVSEGPKVEERLVVLRQIEQQLRALKKEREREPEKRWQAHYDLMLAQIVCAQIKAYEYLACLKEMAILLNRGELRPSEPPDPNRVGIDWILDHSKDRKAPAAETEKYYAEAERLFRDVIARHANTPWADLAQDCLDRGFGVHRTEWKYNPQYQDRAKYVPKY